MHIAIPLTLYGAAASSLVTSGVVSLAMLVAPSDSTPKTIDAPHRPPKVIERGVVDTSAFRYGPDVNHGRSDTPVHASAQARKEANAMRRPAKRIVITPAGRRPASEPSLAIAPSVPSTGH